jgi:hypothetical protein
MQLGVRGLISHCSMSDIGTGCVKTRSGKGGAEYVRLESAFGGKAEVEFRGR